MFAKVADGEEITMSGLPYLVSAFNHNNAPAYGVGYTLSRKQMKHDFADDTTLEVVNTAIERGIADLADFVLLNHLETEAETLASPSFTAVAQKIAAKNLRFDEVKAIVGGDCTAWNCKTAFCVPTVYALKSAARLPAQSLALSAMQPLPWMMKYGSPPAAC